MLVFHHCEKNTGDIKISMEEGLFWHVGLDVSVHGCLALLPLGLW